jgi:hypothetical protein
MRSHCGSIIEVSGVHSGLATSIANAIEPILECTGAAKLCYIAHDLGFSMPIWRTLLKTMTNASFVERLNNGTWCTNFIIYGEMMEVSLAINDLEWKSIFEIRTSHSPETLQEALASLLTMLTSVKSETLVLDCYPDLPADTVTRLFVVFRDTKELDLYGQSATSFLESMAMTEHGRAQDNSAAVKSGLVFPQLQILVLNDVDLQGPRTEVSQH